MKSKQEAMVLRYVTMPTVFLVITADKTRSRKPARRWVIIKILETY